MPEWNKYLPQELEAIADTVWGAGLYRPQTSMIEQGVPCPKCGVDITIWFDSINRGGPQRFRASCYGCSTRGSGRATDNDRREFTKEELNSAADGHMHGEAQYCACCQAPLFFEELGIAGSSARNFKVRCLRCRSYGDVTWPPEGPRA